MTSQLSRREFLRFLALLSSGAVLGACESTPIPSPSIAALPVSTAQATPTVTPTLSPTLLPTPTDTVTATPTPSATPTTTLTATPRPPDLVIVQGDQFYYRGKRFPINGFNYYPQLHPWRTFNVGEWDPNATERELKLGAALGANTVRIFVDYNFSLDLNPRTPTPVVNPLNVTALNRYIANVREFLDIAGRLNLKVIVSLFDSLDWEMYQLRNHTIAEEYVQRFVPSFVNDPRILCWDLQNEPDRAIRNIGREYLIPFFKRISLQVRQLDPNHLQTIGWIDRARAGYFPDLDDYLDFWCFHFYDKVENLAPLVQLYKTRTKKPVLLEEFGLPSAGPGYNSATGEQDQAAHYRATFNILDDNKMCGSVLWCLNDYPIGIAGNPPIKTDSPENHFGVFRLDYSEKPVTAEIKRCWMP